VTIPSSASRAGARPHRYLGKRDARFATMSLAPAGIWFARRLRRGGAFGYNKKLVLLMYLSAPHLRIPGRAASHRGVCSGC
jgi:hypothetical protein